MPSFLTVQQFIDWFDDWESALKDQLVLTARRLSLRPQQLPSANLLTLTKLQMCLLSILNFIKKKSYIVYFQFLQSKFYAEFYHQNFHCWIFYEHQGRRTRFANTNSNQVT